MKFSLVASGLFFASFANASTDFPPPTTVTCACSFQNNNRDYSSTNKCCVPRHNLNPSHPKADDAFTYCEYPGIKLVQRLSREFNYCCKGKGARIGSCWSF
ncbi:hypothetical protein Ptr902_02686 [Pyrenophora tritici-repentis]|uniref:Uncharacterized protein n=1 Tax=Pyrenophora tritici-repentis TaxID=45151 RepID=A0A5M9KYC9_9PLEO|nr:hypothetical protein PtrV1_09011 [Pyrenophora tritici-repentis]KAF7441942.1 hypothetical protein A1F99_137940 [Pyrenophora tritici-repentis]KAF7567954.1 hypothetical protein PtrM4_125670 [Pyrenophora tritici-repentis]KAI0577311.1 hypothetical protein Alg130_08427 [Pyrenophora tritici-repentis]KAI0587828.1 hypothetical protein Alg215_01180 [Pyrenophora tritici-repentis]